MTTPKCEFCNKTFSRNSNYNKHLQICKAKKEQEYIKSNNQVEILKTENTNLKTQIIILTEELNVLKDIIEKQNNQSKNQINSNNIINKPQIIINNNNNAPLSLKDIIANLEPINFEEIKNSFENDYCNKYIDNGIEGLATFICEIPCQNKIITTDYARKLVSYKTSPQQIVVDPNASMLLNTAIKQNADTIIDKAEDRHHYWREQVREAREEDIEPFEIDVKNKKKTSKLIKVASKAKQNVPMKSLEASTVVILKGMENKNNLNALE
jgi:hypothetical protein